MSLALLNREHRFVRVNASFAALNGLSIDEHIGRKLDEIFPDLASRLEPMCRRVFESGHPVLKVKVVRETLAHPEQKKTWHMAHDDRQRICNSGQFELRHRFVNAPLLV